MAKDTKSTITVAIISAISAIVIALITTFGTIALSAPKVNKVKEDLQNIDNIQLIKNLPIGTILASMLKPTEFAKAVGDPNRTKYNWVLADGQKDITTSQYGLLSGKTTPPDLRGVFLRGINEGRKDGRQDPNGLRKVGDYQPDAFQWHVHDTNALSLKWNLDGSNDLGYTTAGEADAHTAIIMNVMPPEARTDVETRPKNVAVYFYIKIN